MISSQAFRSAFKDFAITLFLPSCFRTDNVDFIGNIKHRQRYYMPRLLMYPRKCLIIPVGTSLNSKKQMVLRSELSQSGFYEAVSLCLATYMNGLKERIICLWLADISVQRYFCNKCIASKF